MDAREGAVGRVESAGDLGGEDRERSRRTQRQLDAAQQLTHIGSWEWDARSNAVQWSDELYRIYGLAPQSCVITLDSFVARVHPEDRERTIREVRAAMARGGRFEYPERILRPDGEVRQLQTVGEVLVDDKGAPIGLLGTCRDVTEERKRDETVRLYADIVQNVQIGIGVFEVGDPDDPGSMRMVAFNPAAESVARRPLRGLLGAALPVIAPHARGGELETLLASVARDGQVREAVVQGSREPLDPTRALSLKVFPLPGGQVCVAVEDITPQTRTRLLRDAEQDILERIASGDDPSEVLHAIVLLVEEYAPSSIASILLLDPAGRTLRHGVAPHLPADYTRALDGSPIGPRAGSCGTAAFLGEPVYVEDIESDARWEQYRALALAHGLRACWSTPILSLNGHALGTVALYFDTPKAPAREHQVLLERATHLAGIALQRGVLEEQLRQLSAHIEEEREDERTGIAREIHDELGQALTALKMDLALIARRTRADALSREALLEKVDGMSSMTDEVIDQVRRISSELRPGVLDDLGLLAACEWQAHEFERRTGTPCLVRSNLGNEQLDPTFSTAFFRILQEALTNVTRHAQAQSVDVLLEHHDGILHLRVKDDGRGITADVLNSGRSLGLLGIRERARRIGGEATISGGPGTGTTVEVKARIPVHPKKAS
jgi:PAS domain S-box-containing protein